MWGIISTVFIVLYLLMSIYIGRRGWTALGISESRTRQMVYWASFVFLVFSFPAAEMLGGSLHGNGGLYLTIWGDYTMVAVVYLSLLLLLIDLLKVLDRLTGFVPSIIRENGKTPLIMSILVLAFIAVTLVYGGWNARNPVSTEYPLMLDKKSGTLQQLRIAMVSDIHYGKIINVNRLGSLVRIVDEMKPDIILFAGDTTEGSPGQEEARKLSDVLSRMKAKYGKFIIPGNHDRGIGEDSNILSRYYKEAGVDVLRDAYIKTDGGFYIIGRNDAGMGRGQSRKPLEDIMKGIDSSMPLILLDHQPVDLETAKKCGIDLQLSGHTHKGQIFPANLITRQVYELDWGLLQRGGYRLIVSSGYGTWGPPLRIGNHPEVVGITVKFKSQ